MNRFVLALVASLAVAPSAGAHRLDEYLQATRVAVELNRIQLSIDLTPGVAILGKLLPLIDPAGDGRITREQANDYARRVLNDLHIDLDGKVQKLKLVHATFPSYAEMKSGEGTIHLTAVATMPRLRPGSHEILLRNDHLPKLSVYLVNALIPASKAIEITRQVRDELQKEYRLCLEVTPSD